MKNPTKAERIIHALKQHIPDLKPCECGSRKYQAFESKATKYFVGKSGALRAGGSASTSLSLESKVPGLLAKYPHPGYDPRVRAFQTLQSAMRYIWDRDADANATLDQAWWLLSEKKKELESEIKAGK